MGLRDKNIIELDEQEIIGLHVNDSFSNHFLKDSIIRSTLSFLHEAILHAFSNTRTQTLMPIMSILSLLEQLGICYNRVDLETDKTNGIKRCLILFGGYSDDDEILDVLQALRNGLLHNVSLVSKARYPAQSNYIFRYANKGDNVDDVYKNPINNWDGNFSTLSEKGREQYTTLINVEKLKALFKQCIIKVKELNDDNLISIRLEGGKEELFYTYLRSIPRSRAIVSRGKTRKPSIKGNQNT